MNFSTDRDLLALEPTLFADAPMVGQQRLHTGDAAVDGTTLSSATADFVAAGVQAGGVVLLAGVPLEVIRRDSATVLTVSRLRASLGDAAIPPQAGSGLELIARTFAPQAATVHASLLRMVGIEPDDPATLVTEDMIVSQSVMARLEVLGTLELIFAGVMALTGDNGELQRKTARYAGLFAAACRGAKVLLDLDGDGRADHTVDLGTIRLMRR